MDEAPSSQHASAVLSRPAPTGAKPKRPRMWNVVLLDDADHTYEYVIEMVQRVFAHTSQRAYETAKTVDKHGRAICGTYHRELAELKLEQVHTHGRDPRLSASAGAMSAVLEPVPGE